MGTEGRSSIDDIVELYKRDVDRSLLREQLRKTPGERAKDLQAMVCFIAELRAAVRTQRSLGRP